MHPDPDKRYQDVDEFVHDLRYPKREFLSESRPPLIERNPEPCWKSTSAVLALIIVALLLLVESS